jgi:hypothetical protein
LSVELKRAWLPFRPTSSQALGIFFLLTVENLFDLGFNLKEKNDRKEKRK